MAGDEQGSIFEHIEAPPAKVTVGPALARKHLWDPPERRHVYLDGRPSGAYVIWTNTDTAPELDQPGWFWESTATGAYRGGGAYTAAEAAARAAQALANP